MCGELDCTPLHTQVLVLDEQMGREHQWHEAFMLQHCVHDRIVPLYGVAIKVCVWRGLAGLRGLSKLPARLELPAGLPGRWLAHPTPAPPI